MSVIPVERLLADAEVAAEYERLRRIQHAWRIYRGDLPKPLRAKPGEFDDNVGLNFARLIVDKGVSFLFGQEPRFELDAEPGANQPAEEWLDSCWSANRKMTLLHKLAVNGAVTGHVFVKLTQPDPALGGFPRIIVLDPETVFPTWDPEDIERVLRYRIQFNSVDQRRRRPVVVRQLIEPAEDGQSWTITDQVADPGAPSWTTTAQTVWPYPFPPVLDAQNLPVPNEFWGMSDIEPDVLALQHQINFLLSNLLRIIRYHAHPKTWGRGFRPEQLKTGPDGITVFENPEAFIQNLEMQGDLGSSILLYERLREALFMTARVPEIALGRVDGVGALSGVALRILYQPLLDKTETKRRTYGDFLSELNRRLLVLGGFVDAPPTVVHWPEPIPSDEQAEAQLAMVYRQLGVSQDTLLRRLGFDPLHEAEKRQEERANVGAQLLRAFDQGQVDTGE